MPPATPPHEGRGPGSGADATSPPPAPIAPRDAVGRMASDLLRRVTLAAHRYAVLVSRRLAMPPNDVHAMGVLVMAERPIAASGLGHEVGLSKPAVSAMLQRLTASGHLERAQSDVDARRALLSATQTARAESAREFRELNDAVDAALASSAPADVAAFLRVLAAVADEFDDL